MKKVLFVCLGNICRSPLGEAIFNEKAKNYQLMADSAGTAAYHIGKDPDHRSIKVAQENGIMMIHKARKFEREDFERFDYVLAMDQQNYEDMRALSGGEVSNLYLLREFDPLADGDMDVPDPYYGGYDGFIHVFEMISRSVDQLINHIQREN
ncbi:low molecular weight phosphotyrosine protein phosphatase [Reichenbachiella agarivorans]|uniref:protein-tyrosine-phosphatase n=1 Tax=Reichenbachiella agarivorans TaxID=2979464 RepID=A0ABY6CSJ7_9BACT|nr:low molecular weight protein-tyrosine-phosphatase [Reichenbachiella agarivorans]UXP32965.1 low molecular weight phosphotyrosine protein phosphatase [Reichenbachiella agarivorans]